ncbi:hypothetical protein [Sutcliffiella halmapala]|uniref:hypothetical protein n=1 Tax=Sutcliffiella halmapala TaxID=79882 RepID=UPI000994A918|nr:hypothetical protein [Sutcliffiella halmapala]
MFDPIVFDNLKVVIEGDIYDLDLEGQLEVVDRKDLVDLATMSRNFTMDFTITGRIIGRLELSSNIENIAGELLNRIDRPGCSVKVTFYREINEFNTRNQVLTQWKKDLEAIWGKEWGMAFYATVDLEERAPIKLSAEITFNRLFYEDNIDDLRELVVYVIKSLN